MKKLEDIINVKYKYNTLEDFLISSQLSVESILDDGWGATFPVKGREIYAAVLFADISFFSKRTLDLTSTETLIFVNHFFTWITAEALKGRNGIIDKYIGDEVMIIFSKEFGSKDPFEDAIKTAQWMVKRDVFGFAPHIGIASGKVTIGFVGTPLKYNCSAFGMPVNLASRCSGIKLPSKQHASIIFPAEDWGNRKLEDLIPQEVIQKPDGTNQEMQDWELLLSEKVDIKNMQETEVRGLSCLSSWFPQQTPEERAKEMLRLISQAGLYRPVKFK